MSSRKKSKGSRHDFFAALVALLVFQFHLHGQVNDLSFDPPFRMKDLHWFKTSDGWGESWSVGGNGNLVIKTLHERKSYTISTSGSDLNSLFFIDYHTAFAVGNSGEILLTQDRGKSWKKQESGTKVNLQSIYCVDKDSCWVVGNKGGLLLKGGINKKWKEEKIVAHGEFEDIYFVNKETGYATGRDGLFIKTEDGGETWIRINIPFKLEVSEFIDGIPNFASVVFKNAKIGCVAGWDVVTGIVACTQDGGGQWIVNKVKSTPIGIIWTKADEIYLVDEYGKNLKSTDLGNTWARF